MPFFYSQYLKDTKKPPPSQQAATSSHNKNRNLPPNHPHNTRPPAPSRLVWHSNTGASGKRKNAAKLKPFGYISEGPKSVHFSTIEVQQFHFDWNLAPDVWYNRKELTAMGSGRFDDAALLRKDRDMDGTPNTNTDSTDARALDDVDLAKKPTPNDINAILSIALDDPDSSDLVSIRGIEHFVYPELQQEMIRKKKLVQKEVLEFVRSKRPDPQGWRLAQHSRGYSQWARDVALEKGMKYRMNNSGAGVGDLGEGERERIDSMGSSGSLHLLTSSASFSVTEGTTGGVGGVARSPVNFTSSPGPASPLKGILSDGKKLERVNSNLSNSSNSRKPILGRRRSSLGSRKTPQLSASVSGALDLANLNTSDLLK